MPGRLISDRLKRLLALLLVAALTLCLAPGRTALAVAPGVSGPRTIGVPLRDTLLIGGIVGTLPDGSRVLWSVVSGTPAYVNAVDPTTGEVRSRVALPGASGSYAIRQATDGTIYVGTYGDAKLFRIRPGASSAEDLGNPTPGESFIWAIDIAPDGTVYGGTSPGGKVFSYSPDTGAVRDYGQVAAGQTYVRSLAVANGKVYAGAYSAWVVTELDPVTGTSRALPTPAGVEPAGKVVNDLTARDGYLYARGDSAFPGPLHVYNLATGAWEHRIDGAAGLDVSPADPQGRVWFFRQYEAGTSELVSFDPRTGEVGRTGVKAYGRVVNSRGIGWAPVDDPNYPGMSLVALQWRGMMFRYNPQTKASSTLRASIPGEPTPVLALAKAENGAVWAGGFLQGGVAHVTTADGATDYHRFSQVESLLAHDGELYIGAYPDARVYRYNPANPWYSPEYSDEAPQADANPVKVLDMKADNQMRLKALTATAGVVVAGSTPSGDNLGGAIAVIDPATNAARKVWVEPIEDEGVTSLASDGSSPVVYGTTTVAGGIATTPTTQSEATIFAFDTATGQVLWQINPSAAKAYQAITVDGAGRLWAIAAGRVLQLDRATGAILRTIETGASGSFERLTLNDDGTTLYALTGGSTVTMIDTATGRSVELLTQRASEMVYTNGELVFAQEATLLAWKVPSGFADEPSPTPSEPSTPAPSSPAPSSPAPSSPAPSDDPSTSPSDPGTTPGEPGPHPSDPGTMPTNPGTTPVPPRLPDTGA